MSRLWIQPETPFDGISYDWAGAPHNSVSNRRQGGVIQDHNQFDDPGMTSTIYGKGWTGRDNTNRLRVVESDWSEGGYAFRATWSIRTNQQGDIGVTVKQVAERIGWGEHFTVEFDARVSQAGIKLPGPEAYSSVSGTATSHDLQDDIDDTVPGVTYHRRATVSILEDAEEEARVIFSPVNFGADGWVEISNVVAYPGGLREDFGFFSGDTTEEQETLIKDGGFEDWTYTNDDGKDNGRKVVHDAASAHSGIAFYAVNRFYDLYPGASFNIHLVQGHTYRLRMWMKTSADAVNQQGIHIRHNTKDSEGVDDWLATGKTSPNDGVWHEFVWDATMSGDRPTQDTTLWIQASGSQTDENAWTYFDDVSVVDLDSLVDDIWIDTGNNALNRWVLGDGWTATEEHAPTHFVLGAVDWEPQQVRMIEGE